MAGELSLKTPLTGLVTLVPTNTATDKTITLPATTGTMVVQDATNTTTVVNLTATGTVNVGGGNISPQTGFKNRIINGAMTIDQRNAGASVTPATSNTYLLDRWKQYQSAASKFSVQQSSVAPAGFTNSMLVTSLAATSLAAGDFYVLNQAIEGFNIADLGWGTANASPVTISFWVRSSLTGTFGGALTNSAANRSYPFTYTISAANTFEYKTITIAGDTSGTWLTNSGAGIQVQISLGTGTTYSGTAGAWAGTYYISATGSVSVVGTSGATFYITGVQLEKGSTATPFEFRSIGQELALCQRYYETVSVAAAGASHTNMGVTARYAVVKRAAATLVRIGSWNSGGEAGTLVGINEASQFFVYNPTVSTFNVGGTYTASAEL